MWEKAGLLAALTATMIGAVYCAGDPARWYGFVAAVLAAGLVLLLLWRRHHVGLRTILLLALAFRLAAFALPPSLSDDAYRYVWDGLVQTEGINPYRVLPSDPALEHLQNTPLYPALNSADYHTVYPPISQLIFWFGAQFMGLGWLFSYYVVKAVTVAFEFGAVLLLSRFVAPRMLMWYALNPVVVIEAAGQAHPEAVAVFFLVLTLWLARRAWGGWAGVALAGAVWVKLYPVVLFPFLFRRFGWRAVWPAALVSLLLLAPYAAPDVPEKVRSSLDLYVRLFEFNAGFYYAVKQVFLLATGDDWSKTLGPFFRTVFALFLPICYIIDWQQRWPLHRAFLWAIGAFLVFATTVHPWYLLPMLACMLPGSRPAWHWLWLAFCAPGTYLLYVGGPYWTFVALGWGGWAALALWRHGPRLKRWAFDRRARKKVLHLIETYPEIAIKVPRRVLDLGAGEGLVGAWIQRSTRADVTLADVVDFNETDLPLVRYDGRRLPFEDGAFDVTILYFVLHHTHDPALVFKEAQRVTREALIVVESVYTNRANRTLLTVLDKLANRFRSGGLMNAQEADLSFKTVSGWEELFEEAGASVRSTQQRGGWVHRQATYVVDPHPPEL